MRKLLEEANKRALDIILTHKAEVELMTEMLIEFETLDAADIRDILNHAWDPEKKRKKLKDQENLFKRQPENPPPPPPITNLNEDRRDFSLKPT